MQISLPVYPRAVVQGFREAPRGDGRGFGQVDDDACQREDALAGVGRELEPLGGSAQQRRSS